MPQQLLYDSQIGSSIQEMSSEGMSERMGMRRRQRPVVENAPNIPRRQPVTPPIQEHGVDRRTLSVVPAESRF